MIALLHSGFSNESLLWRLANMLVIGSAWPCFLALVLIVAGAFQQFILLVRMGFHGR